MDEKELEERIEEARYVIGKSQIYIPQYVRLASAVVALAAERSQVMEQQGLNEEIIEQAQYVDKFPQGYDVLTVRLARAVVAQADALAAERERVRSLECELALAQAALANAQPQPVVTMSATTEPKMVMTHSKLNTGPDGLATCEMTFATKKPKPENSPQPLKAQIQDAYREAGEIDATRKMQNALNAFGEKMLANTVEPPAFVNEAIEGHLHELTGDAKEWLGDAARIAELEAEVEQLTKDCERITMDRDNLVVMYNTAHAAADEARKERDEAREELKTARLANAMLAEELATFKQTGENAK